MTDSGSEYVALLERTLRRALETGLECQAAIWLSDKTGGVSIWDVCNSSLGHTGPHSCWSERDSDEWASWVDGQAPASSQVDLVTPFDHTDPSPWQSDELAVLARLKDRAREGT